MDPQVRTAKGIVEAGTGTPQRAAERPIDHDAQTRTLAATGCVASINDQRRQN